MVEALEGRMALVNSFHALPERETFRKREKRSSCNANRIGKARKVLVKAEIDLAWVRKHDLKRVTSFEIVDGCGRSEKGEETVNLDHRALRLAFRICRQPKEEVVEEKRRCRVATRPTKTALGNYNEGLARVFKDRLRVVNNEHEIQSERVKRDPDDGEDLLLAIAAMMLEHEGGLPKEEANEGGEGSENQASDRVISGGKGRIKKSSDDAKAEKLADHPDPSIQALWKYKNEQQRVAREMNRSQMTAEQAKEQYEKVGNNPSTKWRLRESHIEHVKCVSQSTLDTLDESFATDEMKAAIKEMNEMGSCDRQDLHA